MDTNLARRHLAGVWVLLCLTFGLLGCGGRDASTVSAVTEDPTEVDYPAVIDDRDFVDYSRAVGFYTDGSVAGSTRIPDSGPGFLKIFRLRNRGYGTSTLVRTLQLAIESWRKEFPVGDRVQIGDASDSNGGYLSGHASHQNGLDVDISYENKRFIERDPNTNGSGGYREKFVSGGKITTNFDVPRNWGLMKHLVLRGNIGRIFVDPTIKRTFCAQASTLDPQLSSSKRTEVLRRLRPYSNHADHLHVRLKCSANHPRCRAQSEPSKSSGCSASSSVTESEYGGDPDDELGADDDSSTESEAT